MKKILIPLFIISLGFYLFYLYKKPAPAPEVTVQSETPELVEEKTAEKMVVNLKDVTEGSASGKASAGFEKGEYKLSAEFSGLPELDDGYFYEGWVVRKSGELSVLSTGKVVDNKNIFVSDKDLTDHNFYVLTLEPDDGNPDPAEHILEGEFSY
jgi:hypothetical protein